MFLGWKTRHKHEGSLAPRGCDICSPPWAVDGFDDFSARLFPWKQMRMLSVLLGHLPIIAIGRFEDSASSLPLLFTSSWSRTFGFRSLWAETALGMQGLRNGSYLLRSLMTCRSSSSSLSSLWPCSLLRTFGHRSLFRLRFFIYNFIIVYSIVLPMPSAT